MTAWRLLCCASQQLTFPSSRLTFLVTIDIWIQASLPLDKKKRAAKMKRKKKNMNEEVYSPWSGLQQFTDQWMNAKANYYTRTPSDDIHFQFFGVLLFPLNDFSVGLRFTLPFGLWHLLWDL